MIKITECNCSNCIFASPRGDKYTCSRTKDLITTELEKEPFITIPIPPLWASGWFPIIVFDKSYCCTLHELKEDINK